MKKRKEGNSIATHYDHNVDILATMNDLYALHLMKRPKEYVRKLDYVKIPILFDFNMQWSFPSAAPPAP